MSTLNKVGGYEEGYLIKECKNIISKEFRDKPYIAGITIVGSYLWGDNKEDSDIDIAIIYSENVKDLLSGITKPKEKQGKWKNIDYRLIEIEKLIKRYLNGDFNALITILSNKIIFQSDSFTTLRDLVLKDDKLKFYNSIIGMAKSFEKKGNIKKAGRYYQFAERLYRDGIILFNKFTGNSLDKIKANAKTEFSNLKHLKNMFEQSKYLSSLGVKVFKNYNNEIRDFLYRTRLSTIEVNLE